MCDSTTKRAFKIGDHVTIVDSDGGLDLYWIGKTGTLQSGAHDNGTYPFEVAVSEYESVPVSADEIALIVEGPAVFERSAERSIVVSFGPDDEHELSELEAEGLYASLGRVL